MTKGKKEWESVGTNNASKWHNLAREQGLLLAQLTVMIFIGNLIIIMYNLRVMQAKYSNLRNYMYSILEKQN